MSRKVYNFRKCIRNNGITLALIIYYRKILNKAYNYLVLGRLDTHVDSRAKILGLKNVKIGYGSIIGANSVVTKDIPPCSIAVGAPIKVIKTWNNITNKWENV